MGRSLKSVGEITNGPVCHIRFGPKELLAGNLWENEQAEGLERNMEFKGLESTSTEGLSGEVTLCQRMSPSEFKQEYFILTI